MGATILRAVRDTRRWAPANTNLGIVLLLAPLARAALQVAPGASLRDSLRHVLAGLSVADAEAAYEAIRLASPGGLGEAPEQDVARSPTVSLRKAMQLAADRDAIAQCVRSGAMRAIVQRDADGAVRSGARSTPSFYIEGGILPGAQPITVFREILDFINITKVPKTPDFMRGVINLRGSVVPVVDMKLKFGMEMTEKTVNTCIIVLEVTLDGETTIVGALADSVQEVLELDLRQVVRRGKDHGLGAIFFLDLEHLLGDEIEGLFP